MARKSKISLREFQENVVAKLQALSAGEEIHPASKLGFQAHGQNWLVDLADVGEVIPPPDITPVPLSQSWFTGVANVRGNLYSIVDFSAFSGGDAVTSGPDNRLLLANGRFMVNSGLLVNRVLGLRHPDQLQPKEGSEGTAPWAGTEYVDSEGQVWRELNMQALVNDQRFLQAGR